MATIACGPRGCRKGAVTGRNRPRRGRSGEPQPDTHGGRLLAPTSPAWGAGDAILPKPEKRAEPLETPYSGAQAPPQRPIMSVMFNSGRGGFRDGSFRRA